MSVQARGQPWSDPQVLSAIFVCFLIESLIDSELLPLAGSLESPKGLPASVSPVQALKVYWQWLSTFLMLRFSHTVPRVAVTPPTITLCLLLLHYYNLATVRNRNVNIFGARESPKTSQATG